MKANTIAHGTYRVEMLARGEYVHRIAICALCNGDGSHDKGLCAACGTKGFTAHDRVWIRGDYDRSSRRYSLTATDDMNREIFVKRGTLLEAGFTF
jgi:hypothetical protein